MLYFCSLFCFFNDTATTEIYTLSLHDALPICRSTSPLPRRIKSSSDALAVRSKKVGIGGSCEDRKSTRLNSSHRCISYAVFCLKKKKKKEEKTLNIWMMIYDSKDERKIITNNR